MINFAGGLQMYPYTNGTMPYFSYDVLKNATNQRHNHPTDLFDCADCYIMRVNLAGYDKDNIKVAIAGSRLVISARGYALDYGDKCMSQEIPYSDFERKYEIKDIDREAISAHYMSGIVEIKLPKSPEEEDSNPYSKELTFEQA